MEARFSLYILGLIVTRLIVVVVAATLKTFERCLQSLTQNQLMAIINVLLIGHHFGWTTIKYYRFLIAEVPITQLTIVHAHFTVAFLVQEWLMTSPLYQIISPHDHIAMGYIIGAQFLVLVL